MPMPTSPPGCRFHAAPRRFFVAGWVDGEAARLRLAPPDSVGQSGAPGAI